VTCAGGWMQESVKRAKEALQLDILDQQSWCTSTKPRAPVWIDKD
jgi:hypothetical protein